MNDERASDGIYNKSCMISRRCYLYIELESRLLQTPRFVSSAKLYLFQDNTTSEAHKGRPNIPRTKRLLYLYSSSRSGLSLNNPNTSTAPVSAQFSLLPVPSRESPHFSSIFRHNLSNAFISPTPQCPHGTVNSPRRSPASSNSRPQTFARPATHFSYSRSIVFRASRSFLVSL